MVDTVRTLADLQALLPDNVARLISAQDVRDMLVSTYKYSITAAETNAAVTPTDYSYPPGNVLRYGADTTGATSSKTAFQNAINSNTVVTFPVGTFLIDGSINPINNTQLIGSGYASILKLGDAADVPLITFAATNLNYLGVVLDNFRIEGNAANQTSSTASGIFLSNVTGTSGLLARHHIRNLWIHNCKGSGLHLGFATRSSLIENINVYKADQYGIRGQAFSDSFISGCDVGQSGENGFHFTGCGDLGVSKCKSWFSGRNYNDIDTGPSAGEGVGYYINDCGSFAGSQLKSQNNEGDGFYCVGESDPLDGLVLSGCTADADNKSFDAGTSPGTYSGMTLNNVNKGNIQLAVRVGNANGTPDDGLTITSTTTGCVIDLTCDGVTSKEVDGHGIGNNDIRVNGNELHMIEWRDDFIGDVIADQWANATGTDPQVVAPAVVAGVGGGICRLVTGDDAAASMAVNGVQLDSSLQWRANQAGVGFNCYLKLSAITNVAVFVGFTDQVGSLEMPFTLGAVDALTSNASNAVGFLFDTGAATDNWWAVGVATNTDATHFNTAIAPVAGTNNRLHFALSNAGAASFFIDGVQVGTTMTGAVTATTELTPVVAAFSRGAASRNIDVDVIAIKALRA